MEKMNAAPEAGASKRPFRAKIRLATRADAAELQAIYAHYVEKTTVSFEYEAPSVAEMERRIAEVEGVYPFLVCVVEGEIGKDGEIGGNAEDVSPDERGADAKIGENDRDAKSDKTGGVGGVGKTCEAGKADKTDKVGERIVGYALAHRAFERAAYSWVAETAVYVDRDWRRLGIGEALYSALIEILTAQGLRSLYAVVVAENKASVEFHKRAGYREFATFKNSGWKFGRWLDVVWLERTLGVWRDEEGAEKRKENGGPAPSPVRPLAETPRERLAEICAAAALLFAPSGGRRSTDAP